jgi:hypothetical protein
MNLLDYLYVLFEGLHAFERAFDPKNLRGRGGISL